LASENCSPAALASAASISLWYGVIVRNQEPKRQRESERERVVRVVMHYTMVYAHLVLYRDLDE
jgi:hypothetical protein